jgi:PA14 domain-containing protein
MRRRVSWPLVIAGVLALAAVSLHAQQAVTVAWDASVTPDVITYRVYRDHVLQGETAGLQWQFPVDPGVTHILGVTAVNSTAESVPAELAYTAPVPPPPPVTCAAGAFRAEYFPNMTLSGSPAYVACEATITHDWGESAPAPGLPADGFSVRWTGLIPFAAGATTLTATTDDGLRVWLGSDLLIDAWWDQSPTTYTATRTTVATTYPLTVEFYENQVTAVAQVQWQTVPPAPPPPDVTPPAITVFTLRNSGPNARVHVEATDNVALARIDVALDGLVRGTCTAAVCDVTLRIARGLHVVTVTVTDTAGLTATQSKQTWR